MNNMGINSPNNQMGSPSNMMDSLKSNMMTMLMINNMNGKGGNQQNSSNNGAFSMIYMFVATSVVDFVLKNAPPIINFFMKKYYDKLENIKKDLSSVTRDVTDNKVKKKTASITVTINVNNPDNILGQALLDFITNNKNTTHVSYVRESFILNQKDVISIDEDIFARMTQSTAADQSGGQGSTSTNINSGAGNNMTQSSIVQIIEIYSFTKTTDQLRNFLDDIKQKYTINVKNKLGNKRYYFNMFPLTVPMDIDKRKDLSRLPPNFAFVMKHFQTNRKFSNLFGEDIDIIRNRVNFFCKNKKWYDEKGIPYTLGLLLSGSPGTGKTSTIKCLANETNRHICNVNLNNDMTKTQLENLFFNENINVMNPMTGQNETYCIPLDQRIYVLEDVDCQSDIVMERSLKNEQKTNNSENKTDDKHVRDSERAVLEHYEDKHKVDLSFLLNLLDGVLENPGRIVIMTSNFPDTLDSALIRPGRIDVIAKFRNCTNNTVINMIEFFYDIKLSEVEKQRIYSLREEIITPAELSKIMFENFSEYHTSIDHLQELSNKKIAIETTEIENMCDITIKKVSFSQDPDVSSCPEPEQTTNVDSSDTLQIDTKNDDSENLEGFSEEKSTVSCDNNIVNKIEEDTVFVFMKYILIIYTSEYNIKKQPKIFYHSLLSKTVFLERSYKEFVQKIILDFPNVIIMSESLQRVFCKETNKKINISSELKNNCCSYSDSLRRYFTEHSSRFINFGLKDKLMQAGVIDFELDTITSKNDNFLASSSLTSSSFSAY
jgi:DNA polymerase III delta prime subunit